VQPSTKTPVALPPRPRALTMPARACAQDIDEEADEEEAGGAAKVARTQ